MIDPKQVSIQEINDLTELLKRDEFRFYQGKIAAMIAILETEILDDETATHEERQRKIVRRNAFKEILQMPEDKIRGHKLILGDTAAD